ncbi:unnamed protein product [Trichogramma brassicae]|uniref:Vanin C-terminal domain-containing protein n=1 Tax=Trichogramma brassicae TaxID=86971 RepID=A0A6H5J7C8_9HYME|nr:unnamed protein product [Trichogramma brassicae]
MEAGVQICAVVACAGPELEDCSTRWNSFNNTVLYPSSFRKLKIDLKFPANKQGAPERSSYAPTTFRGVTERSLEPYEYEFNQAEAGFGMELVNRRNRVSMDLLTFGIYGRRFDRDVVYTENLKHMIEPEQQQQPRRWQWREGGGEGGVTLLPSRRCRWLHRWSLIFSLYFFLLSECTVARAPMQGLVQFNGKYGCNWGLHLTEYSGASRYPYDENAPQPPLRTTEQTINYMGRVHSQKTPISGVKKVSPLINLEHFDIIRGFVPDNMHCILSGAGKQITELWERRSSSRRSTPPSEIPSCFDETRRHLILYLTLFRPAAAAARNRVSERYRAESVWEAHSVLIEFSLYTATLCARYNYINLNKCRTRQGNNLGSEKDNLIQRTKDRQRVTSIITVLFNLKYVLCRCTRRRFPRKANMSRRYIENNAAISGGTRTTPSLCAAREKNRILLPPLLGVTYSSCVHIPPLLLCLCLQREPSKVNVTIPEVYYKRAGALIHEARFDPVSFSLQPLLLPPQVRCLAV